MRPPLAAGVLAASLGLMAPAPPAPPSLHITPASVQHFYETHFRVSHHWTHQSTGRSAHQTWQNDGCPVDTVDRCTIELGGTATSLQYLFLTSFISSGDDPAVATSVIVATVNRFVPGARAWVAEALARDVDRQFLDHAGSKYSTSRYVLEFFTVQYVAQEAVSLLVFPR